MAAKKVCPQCGRSGTLRIVLYGMPINEPDNNKYILAGCGMSPGPQFDTGCVECHWEGFSTLAKQRAAQEFEKALIEFANRPVSQEEIDRLAAIPKRSKHRVVQRSKLIKVLRKK